MHFVEMFFVALGLSTDTFAVSVSTGIVTDRLRFRQAIRIALVLALFQGAMPLMGWLGGRQVEQYFSHLDHWIAFALLTALGIKMISETLSQKTTKPFNPLMLTVAIGMAVATSIDALVVGVSFAFLEINIYHSSILIGVVTFFAAMVGMLLGKNVSGKFGNRVELLGGIVIIAIGLKILISHLI